jgi:filamentous hemagglutinin family protein
MKRKMWWLKRSSSPHLFARYLMLFSALGVIFLPTSYVWANPAGEQVVGGAATFQRDGNKLTVNQATDRLAVNWQSFNIGAGETTHFNMPSSTSAALNRVIGGNPSSIYGSLSANGILYLINPSGILVGPGGTVNAASFMASTLDVSTEQFMNGKGPTGMHFAGPSGESIVNQGNITAEKGDVFLVAQKVENRGTINAANGTAGMVGSGQSTDVMVHEVGGNGFAIRVAQLQGEAATGSNRDLPDGEELMNEGTISAAQAELNASGNVYALAIRNSGTIRAKAVVANADGTVRLDGGLGDVMNNGTMIAKNSGNEATAAGGRIEVMGQNITASPESIITAAGGEQGGNGGSVKIDSQDTTIVQGKVNVAAPSASAKGGKVELLGERVGLLDGAKVDASGGAGGGTVLAGGDYLGGRTPSADLKDLAKQETEPVKNAKATVMADTAEIKADATVNGDGGKIILWSDEYTGFYGDLFARGGVEAGNGGFIETSSKNNLQAFGSANASASVGKAGMWLLDPQNVSIITGGTGTLTAGVFDPSTPDATIAPATIVTALDGGTSVTITTGSTGTQAGNITVANSVTTAGNTNTDLTLSAANNIVLNAGAVINLSSNAGGADISLLADFDGSGSGTITTSAAITAGTTGTVTLQGSGTIGTGAVVTAQNVVFQGALAGSSIGINDATGLVQISSAALTTNLAATGTVTVGRADGTGTISIGSVGTLNLSGEGYNLALRGASSSAVFNFTGANTLTLKAGGVLTLNLGTGNLFSPGSATTDFTSTTGGMVITSAGQIGSADSSAPFLTSMANLSGTTTGSINITDAGGLTVNGALSSGNANINLNAGTGGAFANTGGTISAGAGAVTLTANTINIANTVTGNGGINLVPDAAATTVAINDATGTFSLSVAELAFLASTSVVSIGSAASSSAFNIGSIGSIDLSAETYDLTILKTSGATTFNFAAGNTLTLQNNGILSFNVGSGTIQGSSLNTTDITIGGNGTISFNSGAVGTTQRLKTSVANYGTSLTSANVFLSSTRAGGVNFGGTFSLGPIGSFDLSLNSAGVVTQDQAILASGLQLLGSGSVTLNNAANNIVTLAGNTTGTGFSYTDSNAFAVGTVSTSTGLTTTGDTTLRALTGLLNVTSPLSVSGGNATLQASAGAITTGAGGTISATGGSVNLQSTGGAITTAAAITSTGGTVTLQSAGGDLTVGGVVSAVDRNINLSTSGNLAVNSGVNAAQGTATLTASTIALAASVIGNGGINLIPAAGTAVGIGSAPTSTFGLTTTEMNFLVSTGTVTFGSSGTRVGAIGLAEGGSISLATNSYNLAFYGSGDVTFGGTLTMGNNRGLTLDVGTGRIISAASGVDLAIGGNGTLGITSSGAVGQTANGPLSTQIANLAGATVSGAFSMDNNNVNLLVNGAVNAAANSVTLTTGTGNLSNTSAINSTGTVTLTTDSQDIQSTIGGTGATIVLAQQTTGRAIQLGTDGPLYSFTSAELGFLQGNTVRIGATTSSGITITAPILMPNVTNLNLSSSGISDSGGTSGISVTGLALTSNGSISLTGSGNSFSTVAALLSGSSVAGASITINDAVSMAIGRVDGLAGLNNSASGNGTISLTSGGSITQTAAVGPLPPNLITTGTGAFTAATTTAGSDILLSTEANDLSSSLFTLGGTQANVRNFGLRNINAAALAPVLTGATALNDVTLTYNSAPLAVPGMDITGNLSVTSGGAMTQSGNILVDGSTTLTAGANTINLSTFAGNDFSSLSALSATGSTISLKDVNGFLMGTTTATGNLTLNAGAAVTQSGIITAPGLELLGAGSFAFGTLNNAITTLAGNVTGNVSFLDNTGYAIGTVNTVGLTSAGNITLSSSAAVTQSQLLAAVGLELLGTGNYTLTNTGNAVTTLAGNVTGNVNFLDNTGYAIGTVNTVGLTSAGNITLQSTGVVTQSQLLAATGLELLGTGGSFTLTSTGNAITTLAGNTGAVSFLDQTGTTPFTIGTVNTVGLTTTGNTTLSTGTSAGTVTQNQKIQASGLELLGGGAYTLGNALNDVTTLAGNTTGAVSYTDANGFAVGTVNTVGLTTAGAANINLTTATGSTGILTTTAAITAGTTGAVTVTANQVGIGAAITGNGGINLVPDAAATTMGLNDAAGTFNLSAAELQFLNSTGTVKIGSGTSTGTLDIGSLGSINLSGASYNLTLQKTSGATTFNFPATTTLTLADNKTLTFTLGTGTVNGSASNTTDITIGGITGGITLTSGAVGATQRLKTAVSQYNASTISGNASLTELNDLVIAGAFSVGANNLSLSSGGVVTQTAAVTASGLELLGLGSYTLTNTGNAITILAGNTGAVSFLDQTGATPFSIGTVNTVGLTTTGNTTLSTGTATGIVTQTQKIQASGLELLGGGAYTLVNALNDVTTLAANLTGITALSSSLNYTDSNGFAVGQVNTTKGITTTSGSVNLTAAAAGNLSVQQAILSGATSTLTAGGEFSSVTSPSGLGTVEVTAGTLTITSATINLASNIKADGGIYLQPSTVGQTIGLNSVTGGFDLSTTELLNLISSGTVVIGRSVDGAGAYTVGGAGAFDLSATSYDLTLEGLTSAIAFSNGITMGNGRTLNLAAGGAITSGATGTDITIGDGFNSGILSISSASTVGISGNALSTAIDQLGASTVATTFLNNSRALQTTGAIGVTGNLTLTTGGTLSQSGTGPVTVSGTTAFTVPTGSDVLMADAANNLGALTLTASGGTTFRDLELRNVNASASVPTVNATRNVLFNFDNAGVALPALTLTGTLDVIAGGGPITQTGILNIAGNSSFASTGFGITLGNSSNIFGSNVSLTTTALQNASLVDSTALVLGTSNISALLNLTSGGSITQATGTTLTTGAGVTTSFTTAASDLLLTQANSISGQVAFAGTLGYIRDVSIQNISTGAQVPVLEGLTNLRDLTLTYTGVTDFEAPTLQGFASLRNISFSAVGPMTQKSGGISNLGTAAFTVTGSGNDITLDDALNNFGLAVSLNTNGGDGTLRESSGLILGTSNLGSGDLSVTTTAGTTTQTGIITASLFGINAGGLVNLTQSNLIDTVAANVTGVGNSFSFANAQDLTIGTVGTLAGITTSSGDIVVSTAASGTSGIITVDNTVSAGGAGNVIMNAQSGGDLLINANIGATGAGTITLLAEGDLTTGGTGVLIGSVNTGSIVMRADSAQSDSGTLTIAANDIVGSTLNSSDYIFSGADLNLAGIVRQSGVGANITLAPTLATGYTELGNNTTPPLPTFSSYVVTADELFNIQSAGTVVVGGSDYLGNISLGDLNLVGNVFKNFLLQSSPGGLTTVGSGASTGTFSVVSSGVNVEIDSRVQLNGNNLNISTTAGSNSAGANVEIQQEFLGGYDVANAVLRNGGLIVNGGTGGNVTANASLGLSQQLGLASITGNDVKVNAIDTNGGVISLTTERGTIQNNGNLNSAYRETIFAPAPLAAGSISLEATGAGRINVLGSINTQGAQGKTVSIVVGTRTLSIDQSGGGAGNVNLSAPLGTIEVGGAIIAYGGDAVKNSLPRGADGTIKIDGNNVGLARDQIAYYGTKIDLTGRNNLIFASQPNYVDPTASVGGVSIIMNQLEKGIAALNDPDVMQSLTINYGETATGQFYMGSGSSIQMFGGDISVDRITAPATSLVGGMTLGEIYTTGRGILSGNVSIGETFRAPVSVNYIDTSGGSSISTSTSSQSGIAGGSVNIYGTAVRIGEVNTSGSSPLSTAQVPAIGGTGGSLSVNGTTVSILGSISTSGGVGAGATGVRSTGGSGGQINITTSAGVILDSVNLSTPTFVFDASGGTGANGGLSGSAGKISLTGPVSAAANGVVSSSTTAATTLDLRYSGLAPTGAGSVVTLGTTSSDTIILGTLITAGGSGVTRGTFTVNGALQVDTLSTAAQPYSIELLGDGSVIQNRVTFLNSGTATIGRAGVTTTFTDGFDALSGATVPSTLKLGGTINTVTATTGSMLANATVLVADTILNSAGNIIQLGSLDGTYGLTLAAGVAGGNTTFTGAVGDTTEVGQITVANGVTGLVSFGSTVDARGIQSASTSKLVFNNDVTLSGTGGATTSLAGTLTLNNQAYLDGDLSARLSLLGAGSKTISATTTLSGGPIEFGGGGDYTVSGTISGAQNLILSGGFPSISGAKNFTGDIDIGDVNGGPTITMSGGYVSFRNLTTADGIISNEDPKVTFQGVTTLGFIDTNTTLSGGVDLIGTTLTSAGNVQLGRGAGVSVKLDGVVIVNGSGAVTVKGTVTDNAGFISFTQTATAGKISFDQTTVTLDVATGRMTLNGNVGLGGFISGTTLSTAGTVTLGDSLTDSITLDTGGATLTGTGTYEVNGVVVGGGQNLTLSGTAGKTFAGAASGLGTLALTAGTGTFNSTVSGVAFNQSGGVAVLNGNGTFTGASTLGGTGSTTLNGIAFSSGTTAVTGALTSTGATTITGGLITLNTASAVTSNAGGVLTMGSAVSLGQGATLSGAGAYKLSGAVNGANSLNLTGTGAKTFSGAVGTGTALSTITQANDSGLVTFADDVTMSGTGAFNANLVLDGLTLTSTGSTLTIGSAGTDTAVISGATTIQTTGQNITLNSATTLNAALTTSDFGAVGGTTTLSGTLTGKSSNLTITTDNLTVGNTVQTGSGVVSLVKKNGGNLQVGGTTGFLDATEISEISTSGGLTVATAGDITINQLVSGNTDQITGAFRMVTTGGDIDVAQSVQLNVFSGSAIAGALTATGSTLTARLATQAFQDVVLGVGGLSYDGASTMSLSGIQVTGDVLVSSVEAMTVNGSVISGTGDVALESLGSNLNVLGAVTSAGSMGLIASRDVRIGSLVTAPDAVFVDAGGYFINSFNGNPFRSADTRVATTDIFGSNWPSNGAVPGLQVVYGVSDAALVQANQIGVSTTLLAGNGAPYVLQFTTGTGQPYIFAQQAAIPPVMLPAALTGGSGFTKAVSYSPDEIEMMTPAERSAYENQQRQMSSRVILQGEGGEGEEIGAPAEGRTPQASSPQRPMPPIPPTAQVLLEGKPLAGAKSDQERGDAKRILKVRPTRAVALRSGLNVNEVIESERMAAEVSVGSAPVVQNR